MYAVIFRAEINELDPVYYETASRMREIAIKEYGCIEFNSACENGFEIAISYWDNLGDIKQWKHNQDHINAQKKGISRWYQSYQVQVVEIVREYGNGL